jgi:hypothetical protein
VELLMPTRLAACRRSIALVSVVAAAIVTLSLSKGAPPAVAAPASEPLLVSTPQVLVYADGDARKVAGAGALASGFKILSTMADGSVLVAYRDAGAATVEAIGRDLSPRAVKRFGVIPIGLIAPANDGFLTYDGSLLRRYDARGSLTGPPMAPQGVRDALGFADANVVIGAGRLAIYDRNGRLQHQMVVEADRLVALPDNRFAVTDTRFSEVRVYTTTLELKSTLRFPNRTLLAVAAGADGTLAIANGRAACSNPDVEVDVFQDINAQPTTRLRTDVGTPVALAVSAQTIYVANSPCRFGEDGYLASFGRDGTPHGAIANVGSPTGVLPFGAAPK